jgi:hypothetical protein
MNGLKIVLALAPKPPKVRKATFDITLKPGKAITLGSCVLLFIPPYLPS